MLSISKLWHWYVIEIIYRVKHKDTHTYIQFIIDLLPYYYLGANTPNRRQSTGDNLFSFKLPVLPILKDLGIVPPRGKIKSSHDPYILSSSLKKKLCISQNIILSINSNYVIVSIIIKY